MCECDGGNAAAAAAATSSASHRPFYHRPVRTASLSLRRVKERASAQVPTYTHLKCIRHKVMKRKNKERFIVAVRAAN